MTQLRVYLEDSLLKKDDDPSYPYIANNSLYFGTSAHQTHYVSLGYDNKSGFYVTVSYEPGETLTLDSLIIPHVKFLSFIFTDKKLLYKTGSYQNGGVIYKTERDVIPDRKIQFENGDLIKETGKVCVKAETAEEFNSLMDKFFKGELKKGGVDKTAREVAVEYQPRLQVQALKLESNLWIKIGYGFGFVPDKERRKLTIEELQHTDTPYEYIIRNIKGLQLYIFKTRETRWYRIGCFLRFC